MKALRIKDNNNIYDSSLFFTDIKGNIYSFNNELGFMMRNDLNIKKLEKHLNKMKKEGFIIEDFKI